MGGRGGSSGVSTNVSSFANKLKGGTDDQLLRAERIWANYISSAKNSISTAKLMTGESKKQHLAHHTESLKHLSAQMKAIKQEKKKRGL